MRAHPRSRGENVVRPGATILEPGSSPLTRGKRVLACEGCVPERLIPAHAGKTIESEIMPEPGRGSSPLTRGKHPDVRAGRGGPGLIPAHAGKTGPRWRCRSVRRAHPRSRGENVDGAGPVGVRLGLIPAHAGKTSGPWRSSCQSWAHPRSRGENKACADLREAEMGSSPLTRGKPAMTDGHVDELGLIPAHAGKTSHTGSQRQSPPAHPRSRGENGELGASRSARAGSSPLTRGKLGMRGPPRPPPGLIPAHAGKTNVLRLPT